MTRRLPLPLLVLGLLFWAGAVLMHVLPDLAGRVPHALFLPTQAWSFDHMAGMLSGEHPWQQLTQRIGGPNPARLSFLAWGPALLLAPATWLGGALLAVNLAMLTLPLGTGVLTFAWLRARGLAASAAAAGGLLMGTSLPMLSYLVNGQVCKASLWVLPLLALCVELAPRRWSVLLLSPIFAFASVFSDPTISLVALVAVPPLALDAAWRAERRGPALLRIALLLLPWLPALLLGAAYYRPGEATDAAFEHAGVHSITQVVAMSSASPVDLIWPAAWSLTETDGVTVAYLGLPCLLAVLWAAARRLPGAGLALGLVAVGATLALGEHLMMDGQLVERAGVRFKLPAGFLADLGFPMRESGHYDRFVVTAWLGAALGLATALGDRPRLSLAAGLLVLVHSLGVGHALWPLGYTELEGRAELSSLAQRASRSQGRLLDLPGRGGSFEKGMVLLRASLHRHPVEVLPRAGLRWGMADHMLRAPLARLRAGEPGAAAELRSRGVSAVLWTGGPEGEGPPLSALEAALGPGEEVGPYRYWSLSPGTGSR